MRPVQPMLATAGALPTGRDWAYEFKWDGVRTLVDSSTSGLTLTSRLGNDVTVAYPELAGLAEVADDVLLDGEVVSLVDGRPSFSALQTRMHVRKAVEARRLAAHGPGHLPGLRRAAALRGGPDRPDVRRPAGHAGAARGGRPALDGLAAVRRRPGHQAGRHGQRAGGRGGQAAVLGLPARASAPTTGSRSGSWNRQEFVVGGWEHGEGGRSGGIGSLLLGVYEGAELIYAGQVGTGFSAAALRSMEKRLRPYVVDSSPFVAMPPDVRGRPITWVRPEVVVEVEFAEWTVDGRLRFASFQGVRTDKRPEEVVRER